jgi:hypothetical protein
MKFTPSDGVALTPGQYHAKYIVIGLANSVKFQNVATLDG